jgi:predicted N-acyltransferase
VTQSPDLDELFPLFWQTYERGATKFERLNRRVFELLAAEPSSHVVVLRERASGAAVAFMLCFDLDGLVVNKFIGLDYSRPREWLLYFRLWDAAVDFALARGAAQLQSGQTGYRFKLETGHRLVPLTNWCRHSNPLVHRVYRFVASKVDWSTLDDDLAA